MLKRYAAAALVRDHSVLLCLRAAQRSSYPSVWDFPGGHIEPEELPPTAVRREIMEELGVTITLSEPPLHLVYREIDAEMYLWRIVEWDGNIQNNALDEHDELRWCGMTEIATLKLAHPAYIQLIAGLLDPQQERPSLPRLLADDVAPAHSSSTLSHNGGPVRL